MIAIDYSKIQELVSLYENQCNNIQLIDSLPSEDSIELSIDLLHFLFSKGVSSQ